MSDVVSVEVRLNLYADLLPAVFHADKTVASIILAVHALHMSNIGTTRAPIRRVGDMSRGGNRELRFHITTLSVH